MIKIFHIPGIAIPFRQSLASQGITSDAYFLYLKAKEIIENDQSTKSVLDLGTGCGIILLMLAKDYAHLNLIGVEIVPDLAKLAEENFHAYVESVRPTNYEIHVADFCDLEAVLKKNNFDLIVSNPPYYEKNKGKVSRNYEKAIARFEIKSSLKGLLSSVKKFLSKNGSSLIMYPYVRKKEVEEACLEMGLKIRSFIFTDYERNDFHNDCDKITNKTKIIFEIAHA